MAKVLLACVGVVLIAVVVAFGLSDSPTDKRELAMASVVKGKGSPRLACSAAAFALGKAKGTIDFTLRCDGAGARGTNRVYIARFSASRPGVRSDFRAVSLEGEKGTCRLRRGIASCTAPRGEAVALGGELRVPPGLECARTISAYVVPRSRCKEPASCSLEFDPESLFLGRPKGCASQ